MRATPLALSPLLGAAGLVAQVEPDAGTEPPVRTLVLTLQTVAIAPLGADPDIPWTVHVGRLLVRASPTTQAEAVCAARTRRAGLGQLLRGRRDPRGVAEDRACRPRQRLRPPDLRPIPDRFTRRDPERSYPDGAFHRRPEALEQLSEMMEAAHAAGVKILVSSSYRSGPLQASIYGSAPRATSRKAARHRQGKASISSA
jgi:hypothetical protein